MLYPPQGLHHKWPGVCWFWRPVAEIHLEKPLIYVSGISHLGRPSADPTSFIRKGYSSIDFLPSNICHHLSVILIILFILFYNILIMKCCTVEISRNRFTPVGVFMISHSLRSLTSSDETTWVFNRNTFTSTIWFIESHVSVTSHCN